MNYGGKSFSKSSAPLKSPKFARNDISVDMIDTGVLVICFSAGIGRTGTFIALDSLLKQAKLTNQVQVFNFVKHMRKDRMNMIQTAVRHPVY